MKPGSRKTLTLLLLGIWALAIAQAPPAEEQGVAAAAGGQAQPCVPASDTPQATAGESGPLKGPSAGAEPAVVPCEEQAAATEPEEEQLSGAAAGESVAEPAAIEEEDPGGEASADEVFTPGDEISEDYPVPLPADI